MIDNMIDNKRVKNAIMLDDLAAFLAENPLEHLFDEFIPDYLGNAKSPWYFICTELSINIMRWLVQNDHLCGLRHFEYNTTSRMFWSINSDICTAEFLEMLLWQLNPEFFEGLVETHMWILKNESTFEMLMPHIDANKKMRHRKQSLLSYIFFREDAFRRLPLIRFIDYGADLTTPDVDGIFEEQIYVGDSYALRFLKYAFDRNAVAVGLLSDYLLPTIATIIGGYMFVESGIGRTKLQDAIYG